MANEANIIKIKRSGTSGAPASLKLGELAYSYLTATGNPTSNGGDRLFIGANGVNGGTGNANDVIVIGGKYFTDLLDHERGILTASSALVVDANKKLDELLVDNLSLNGDTLSATGTLKLQAGTGNIIEVAANNYIAGGSFGGSQLFLDSGNVYLKQLRSGNVNLVVGADGTATSTLTFNNDGSLTVPGTIKTLSNGDLILAPHGTGKVQINTSSNSFTLPGTRTATNGYVLTANTDGTTSWAASASALSLKAGTGGDNLGSDATIDLLTDSLELRGEGAISTDLTKTTSGSNDFYVSKIKARFATTSLAGVATFDSDTFSVGIVGDVDVKSGGISNTQLANSTTYLGSTLLTLGDDSGDNDTLAGLSSVTFDGSTSGTSVLQAQAVAGTTTFTLPTTTGTLVGTGDSGSVTNTMLEESTISGISLGDDLADLTVGTNLNLSSAGTTYNGGTAQTINLDSALTGITSISASGGTGDVTLNNGTDNLKFDTAGQLVLPKFTFPNASGTEGQVLVWSGIGASSVLAWADISTSFTITGTSGSESLDLLTDTFNTVSSDSNLSIAVTKDGTTVTSTITLASSLTGVSIDGNAGSVTNGVYTTGTYANPSWITNIDYNILNGTVPTWNQDTTGNAGSVTNGVYTTGTYANPSWITNIDYNILNGTVPTWNQDTTGEAGSVTNSLSQGSNIETFSFDGSSTATVALSANISLTSVYASDSVESTNFYTDNLWLHGSTIESGSATGDVVLVANNGGGDKSFTFGGDGTLNVAGKITGVATPTDATDAANKAYVDATRSGLDVKASVRAATTANITLSNTQTIDGVALAVDNRVLVKNQSTASENGIYIVKSGAWIRAEDADNTPAGEVTSGMFTFVEEGTAYADSGWVLSTNGTITLDTTALTFVQFSGAGQITAGSGLSKTGNTLDVNVANGIEISGDNVQLASSVAGNGLTYTTGVLNVVGTTDRISVSADAIDIATTYAGQTSITTLGTIGTGTWQGSLIGGTYGGTGVNNGSNTITIAGNVTTGGAVTFSGAHAFTGTLTAATSVTFPTTGTLVNKDETTLSSLSTVGTIGTGVWQGTVITYAYGGTGQSTYAKGDILYASAANTLSKLAAGTNGQTLQLQDGLPVWAELDGGTY
jgi:hypothetical protein